ncbi:S26 family signal peptidase [Phenylobacterium sp. 58.2.17]|uniref:S26 family signal peptidase n=1 Tax=Phenylobacterium sp. 58.2.17 TaxID=2969306 RepID=UPI002263D7DE|nr:S26 family signal peptidase [Phenylobacterium sp. 58.2.17]MCX7587293.1 S26 family signal peptidase [Phenylobacterium sp. 58.2.17]
MTPTARTSLVIGALAASATTLTLWRDPPLKLLWNASASAPIGLYWVDRPDALRRGDLVVARPGAPLAAVLAERGYLASGVPLIKPLAALPGQRICRSGLAVLIDGVVVAQARTHDRRGRSLPVWRGCQSIAPGAVFLMNPAHEDSLDGRYFGPLPATALVGRARPFWVAQQPNDRSASGRRRR